MEFSLTTINIKAKNFLWRSSFNITIPKNKLVSFPNLSNTGYAYSLVVGKTINIIKAFHYAGVDSSAGIYQFLSSSGKPIMSPDYFADRTDLINYDPLAYGGLENTFRYKNIEMSFLVQFVKQNGPNYFFGSFLPGLANTNEPTSVLSRWQNPGDMATTERFNSDYNLSGSYSNVTSSNAAYTDASFIRLKNIAISWDLPSLSRKSSGSERVKFYLHAQNLFTITKYIGLDPETKSSSTLPPLRVITFGIQVSL